MQLAPGVYSKTTIVFIQYNMLQYTKIYHYQMFIFNPNNIMAGVSFGKWVSTSIHLCSTKDCYRHGTLVAKTTSTPLPLQSIIWEISLVFYVFTGHERGFYYCTTYHPKPT